jgi:DNA-3-methyladenine glycosylase
MIPDPYLEKIPGVPMERLEPGFYTRDALLVAPELLGKILVRKLEDGQISRYMITEVEAYRGEEDLACHAAKGRTDRTEIMYHAGGCLYVYLIYGIYWMLNIVVAGENQPQAVLIRGLEGFNGPGKLSRALQINKGFYGEDLNSSGRIWILERGIRSSYISTPRIGIEYAGEWKDKPWRYILK